MADVAMPRLSDSMEEGTIVRWLKSDGDEVRRGEEIVEIETDKANMTYEAEDAGVLSIVAGEGDTLAVGEVIARIGEGSGGGGEEAAEPQAEEQGDEPGAGGEDQSEAADEDPGEPADEGDEPEAGGEEQREPADEHAQDATPADDAPSTDGDADAPAERDRGAEQGGDEDGGGRLKVSPVARRLARERGISLEGISGSGPGGRIVKADVEDAAGAEDGDAAEAPEADADAGEADDRKPEVEDRDDGRAPAPSAEDRGGAKGDVEVDEPTRLQQIIARRMAESKATAPDFQLTVQVEMDAAVALRTELHAAAPDDPAPSFNDFVVKAAALALRDHPRANGAYRDGRFERYGRVNVGIAVAGQDALVVPTIFDADRKSLGQIAREAHAAAERVREGKITPPELSGGTFTVSNLGMYGITRFVAVINPPQAAILAVGALEPRAVVRDGEVVARTMMDLTLSCDHRILYGAEAAEFLAKIRERLERPLLLAL